MNVNTMRAVDRWAGIPLCFLFTLVRRIFGRRGERVRPKRILFLELSEMGSAILADPAMRKAQSRFDAELYFVIFKKNAPSLGLLGTVPAANIRTIRESGLFILAWDVLGFMLWARRRKIDTAVDFELFSRFSTLLGALSGAANRTGFYRFHNEGCYRGELLTHRVAYNPHIHIAKNFVALINALLASAPEVPYSKSVVGDDEITIPRVLPGDHETQQMRDRIRALHAGYDAEKTKLVLLNPNASELLPHRRWPPEHYARLAQDILNRWPEALVLITGAPSESAEAEALRARVAGDRIVNFTGRTQLDELPLLYSLASLMVSNDSGPGHFAAASDMPTIVLFGPETPALYKPLGNTLAITAGLACSPCVSAANHRRTACTNAVCMTAIHPDRVLAAVAKVLDEGVLAEGEVDRTTGIQ